MSGLLQLSCSSSEKLAKQNLPGESDPVEVQKYQLDGVKGAVCTTQKVLIPPFQTMTLNRNAGVKGQLYEGACPHRASSWSPVASSSGAHSYLWRATSWLIKGTNLLMQHELTCRGNTS